MRAWHLSSSPARASAAAGVSRLPFALAAALLLLLLTGGGSSARHGALAADADGWRSQIIYFLLTDRFAQPPGSPTPAPCKLTEWNGGAWSGITNKLDYIQDLGMTAVWITPIPYQWQGNFFGTTGYAGYWAQDWGRLEPHYGSEADLKGLLAAAKDRGMLTMLDVVANHVAPVHNDFSAIVPFDDPGHYHGCSQGCDANCGIPPQAYGADESSPSSRLLIETCRLQGLPDLNQSVPFVRQALLGWLQDTLAKYEFDGVRVDTVKHVSTDFWPDYTAAAGRFTLGEVMHGDSRVLARYLGGPRPSMTSLLNFPIYYKLTDAFGRGHDLRTLAAERALQASMFEPRILDTLGTFADNHDMPRFLEVNRDVQLFKNALAYVLLAQGIPVIYYGSEAGEAGGTAGDANRGCLWEAGYRRDGELFTFIAALARLRTQQELWRQPHDDVAATADCYAFTRGPELLVVLTNAGSTRLERGGHGISDSGGSKAGQGQCSVVLPKSFRMLRAGLNGVRDVLQGGQATGLKWDASSRTLLVSTPQGAPRVLTSLTPAKPAIDNSSSSSNGASNSSSSGVASSSSSSRGVASSSMAASPAGAPSAPGSAPAGGREAPAASSGCGALGAVQPLLALLALGVLLQLA